MGDTPQENPDRDAENLDPEIAQMVAAAELRAALRSFLRVSERIAHSADLTPQRYLLLLMIKGAPDGSQRSTVSELTTRLQLAQSTVTELVQRAEEAGLLQRDAIDPKTRAVGLRLTAEGERRLAQAFGDLAEERRFLRHTISGLDL